MLSKQQGITLIESLISLSALVLVIGTLLISSRQQLTAMHHSQKYLLASEVATSVWNDLSLNFAFSGLEIKGTNQDFTWNLTASPTDYSIGSFTLYDARLIVSWNQLGIRKQHISERSVWSR